MRLVQCMQVRHTDRRPVSDEPVPTAALERDHLGGRRRGLPGPAPQPRPGAGAGRRRRRAATVEAEDPQLREELAYWTSRAGAGTGLPPEVLPAAGRRRPPCRRRDFGRPGTLPVGPGHDRAAVYALLHGDEDEPDSWLRAGEALSAGLADRHPARGSPWCRSAGWWRCRAPGRRCGGLLAGLGYPYLVLRLGIADPAHAGPPHTPRLDAAQVVDTSAVRERHGCAVRTTATGATIAAVASSAPNPRPEPHATTLAGAEPAVPGPARRAAAGDAGPGRRGGDQPGAAARAARRGGRHRHRPRPAQHPATDRARRPASWSAPGTARSA